MFEYPDPDPSLLSGAISILSSTIAYLLYLYTSTSEAFNKWLEKRFVSTSLKIRKVLYQRFFGALVYGIIPFLIILLVFQRPLSVYGFSTQHLMKSFLWWIPLAVVVVILSYFGARSEKNLKMYPQIRVSEWDRGLLTVSALSWTAYLVGYEFMFRGYLLFSCLESFGYWPAIVINICLYSLFHIHKGSREAIGSLFFGSLLCYFTLFLGSFWFAIFIHITMALSNEWFSLGFQPEMNLIKSQRRK